MGAKAETTRPGAAVLRVAGPLDLTTGLALLDAVRAAVTEGTSQLEIDLCEVTDWSPEGAAALVDCRDTLDDLHYRTNRGAGREALLAAFAEVDTDLGGTLDADAPWGADAGSSAAARDDVEIDLRPR